MMNPAALAAAQLASLNEAARSFLRHAEQLPQAQRLELAPAWEILAGAICKLENGYFPPTAREQEIARLRARGPARREQGPRCIRCGCTLEHGYRCAPCEARDVETSKILAGLLARDTSKDPGVRAAALAYSLRPA